MRKGLMLALVLLTCGVWLQAQDTGKPSNLETISGCLHSSEGEYTLIDDTETIQHLVGGASKLKHEVGHEVEIAGKPGVRTTDTTPAGGASSAVEQAVFEVKSVKHIADTCK